MSLGNSEQVDLVGMWFVKVVSCVVGKGGQYVVSCVVGKDGRYVVDRAGDYWLLKICCR